MPAPLILAPVVAGQGAALAGQAVAGAVALYAAADFAKQQAGKQNKVPLPPQLEPWQVDPAALPSILKDWEGQFWGAVAGVLGIPQPPNYNGKPLVFAGTYASTGRTRVYSPGRTQLNYGDPGDGVCVAFNQATNNPTFDQVLEGIKSVNVEYTSGAPCGARVAQVRITDKNDTPHIIASVADVFGFRGDPSWNWRSITFTKENSGDAGGNAPALLNPGTTTGPANRVPPLTYLPPEPERKAPSAPPVPFMPERMEPIPPIPNDPAVAPPGDPGTTERPKAPPITSPPPAPAITGPKPPPQIGAGAVETGSAGIQGPARLPGPVAVPVGPDGRPLSPAGAGPITTPPGQTAIGTVVIPGTGVAPKADLEGIAQEVGKIERKLELMLAKPSGTVEPPDWTDLLQTLIELLTSQFAAGSYTLVAPCPPQDVGGGGSVAVANWQQGTGRLELLSRKLDALAELIQAHKDQGQPICAQRKDGQAVTVQFQEIG